ncbi:MAG: hypothetical protein WCK42_08800 [Myxococcaceae bacterium]
MKKRSFVMLCVFFPVICFSQSFYKTDPVRYLKNPILVRDNSIREVNENLQIAAQLMAEGRYEEAAEIYENLIESGMLQGNQHIIAMRNLRSCFKGQSGPSVSANTIYSDVNFAMKTILNAFIKTLPGAASGAIQTGSGPIIIDVPSTLLPEEDLSDEYDCSPFKPIVWTKKPENQDEDNTPSPILPKK